MEQTRTRRLKAPIFFTQSFLSAEQTKFMASKAANLHFMKEDMDKAKQKFEQAGENGQ